MKRKVCFSLLPLCLLLVACGPAIAEPTTTFQMAETQTAAPTTIPSPSPTYPAPEIIEIPQCVANSPADSTNFNELLVSLSEASFQMESFRFRTLYRYTIDGEYSKDDLSIQAEGAYSGVNPMSEDDFFPQLTSQLYDASLVKLTDLRTNQRTEVTSTQEGFWFKQDETGWTQLDFIAHSEFVNLADNFSPQLVLSFMLGGGGLLPGVRVDPPLMAQTETINGTEVIHRCWVPNTYEGADINAYLIHYESLYTFLKEAEIHIWTTQNDSQLVRLVLTGQHTGERLGEDDFVEHNPPIDFLLWMDISELGEQFIKPPTSSEITVTISSDPETEMSIAAPYNELPLPTDARKIDAVFGYWEGLPVSREFFWPAYTIQNESVPYAFLGRGWFEQLEDLRPVYETTLTFSETVSFYLTEMERRGWQLSDNFLQTGLTHMYLLFQRDGVLFLISVEQTESEFTRISAVLPPEDKVIHAILEGWTAYSSENSALPSNTINALVFDNQGQVWVAHSAGLSSFDGNTWTNHPFDKARGEIQDLTIDQLGTVWVGTDKGLFVFDGQALTAYDSLNAQLPGVNIISLATDHDGKVWIAFDESAYVSMFDGNSFFHFTPEEIGIPNNHPITLIAVDPQGQVWTASAEGGVYMYDGENWHVQLEPVDGRVVDIHELAFGPRGSVWVFRLCNLLIFNGNDWLPPDSDLPFYCIDAISSAPDGNLWVTDSGRIFGMDLNGSWNEFTPLEYSFAYITDLQVDSLGRVWVGTENGLFMFVPPPSGN